MTERPSFGMQNQTKNVWFYITVCKIGFRMVDFNAKLLNGGGIGGPCELMIDFSLKFQWFERCNYPIPWKVNKQPDENITTWNCSQAPLYHIIPWNGVTLIGGVTLIDRVPLSNLLRYRSRSFFSLLLHLWKWTTDVQACIFICI